MIKMFERNDQVLNAFANRIFTLGCDKLTHVHDLDNFPLSVSFECGSSQSDLYCPSFFLTAIRMMVWIPLKSHIRLRNGNFPFLFCCEYPGNER